MAKLITQSLIKLPLTSHFSPLRFRATILTRVNMKIFKIILLSILSLLIIMYLAFLFVLPNVVDLNQYNNKITQAFEKSTGFLINIKGLKLKTAWNLSCGASIEKTDLKYPTGLKFAQIDNMDIKLSLVPLFLGQIQIDKISAEKLFLNFEADIPMKIYCNKLLFHFYIE